ncbi:MAG TPA: ATP-binding protein [Casimicrobiaceae bacterium]|nr:ATP-binding protein [Casimicrobiaceae bacterium]
MIGPQTPDHERVLVLAPTSTDAALSRSLLAEAGLACNVCADLREVSRDLVDGAGAILLTDEVIADRDIGHLVEVLRAQPTWSDVPILVLLSSGAESSAAPQAMELLGNVTVLERPVRVTTLVSALRTAIRARRRQYQLRDQLADLTQAEKSLRTQSERLRLLWEAASVLLTTDEPEIMMQALFAKIAPPLGLDAYFTFSVNDAGDALRLESCAGIPEEEVRKIGWLDFGQAVPGTVAQQQQPIVATSSKQSDDPIVGLIKGYGFRAYACSRLMAEGRLLGMLSFASRQRDQFEPDELEFLQTISRYVTVAYERMRLIHKLRDTDRRKDEFLATLAHELRNPLAPIRNALQIMRLTGNDKAAVEQARIMMDRQLGQMVRLIDDLLDVSRITRGKLELRKERVELAAVIKNAVDTARPHIEASGHELFVSLPTQPVYLDADPVRLAQVFSNLLNNAAKYMERGGKIWLAAERRGNLVDVTVRDTGIGIPPEALSSIFEMFAQVDISLEKAHGGLGIGLTLVKRLVEMHGGSVEARSAGVGRGAEFTAHLPVLAESPPSHAESEDDDRRPSAVKCRILVADDNGDAAESMGMMLRLMGNEVRTVRDGMEAVEEAAAFRPDVILLDIGMPRLNGYDAARRIREQRWGKGMFLVALTGWGQDEDKRRATEAGFDLHFTKPVNPADLEQLVAGLHTHSNARANAPTAR